MSNELAALRARVARLEAKEAVLSAFNRYLYSLDTGFGDDVIDSYTEDAVLDVPNFPGADGKDLHFEGRAEIAPLYAPYAERGVRIGGGHHSANIAVNVGLDLRSAEVSAYFMTATPNGVQGGRYEGVMRHEPDGKSRGMRNFSGKVVRKMVCKNAEGGGRIWKVKRAFDFFGGD